MDTNAPADVGKSEIGNLDGHVAGLLCYIFMLIPGLIFYFGEPKNPFVRFHALQVLLLVAAEYVLGFAIVIVSAITCGIGSVLSVVMVVPFVFRIIALVKCVQKQYYMIPLVGELALKWSAPKA